MEGRKKPNQPKKKNHPTKKTQQKKQQQRKNGEALSAEKQTKWLLLLLSKT